MLNLAVVGLGVWGQRHVRSARRSGRFNVAVAVDPETERARPIAEKLGLRLFSSIEQVLANDSMDAISLATPHTLHANQIILAADFGKHVYSEKPFALNARDAKNAVSAAKNSKITIGLGHDQRHYPAVKKLRKMLNDRVFGSVLHVETNLSHNSVARLYKDASASDSSQVDRKWRLKSQEAPIGPISQFGIHRIDTFIHLFGEIDWVFAASSSQGVDPSFIDTLSITLGFKSGVTGFIGNSLATPLHSSLRIFGTKIWAESTGPDSFDKYRECSLVKLLVFSEESRSEETFDIEDSVAHNFESFADDIEGKADFIISPEEMIHNISVVDAIGKSLKAGTKTFVDTN